jgi:hypothetical protein
VPAAAELAGVEVAAAELASAEFAVSELAADVVADVAAGALAVALDAAVAAAVAVDEPADAPLELPALPPPAWRSAPNKLCKKDERSCGRLDEEADEAVPACALLELCEPDESELEAAGLFFTYCCRADSSEE